MEAMTPGRRPPPLVAHGGAPAGVLDLSTGLNPLGTPERVIRAIRDARFGSYADLDAADAERALATDAGVSPESAVLTAGATEAIRLVLTRQLGGGDRVVIAGPTYGEFARVASSMGAETIEVQADAPDFAVPVEALAEAVRRHRARAVIICDPNNPTGSSAPVEAWHGLLSAFPDVHVVVDESFALFRPALTTTPTADPRLTVIRSLTKLHAIPGVRVGYIVAHPDQSAAYRAWRDPWSPGAHAIAAAASGGWRLAAADRAEISTLGIELERVVERAGWRAVTSDTSFRLVEVGAAAHHVRDQLFARGVAVRWCASMGLSSALRLRVPSAAELRTLTLALSDLAIV